MNNTFFITATAGSAITSSIQPVRTFKGDTDIVIDFSNIVETNIKLIKLQIDFGDNTSIEKVYGSKEDLFTPITHTYYPSDTTYISAKRCSVSLVFSNFTIHNIVLPINIAQASFLSEYGTLTVKRAQFIDSVNVGDMFLVLESEKHNLYNATLKSKMITSTYTSLTAVDNLLITEDEDLFATNFDDNIKVTSA